MPLSRDLIRDVRSLDEYDLRRLTIFIRGLMLARDDEVAGAETEDLEAAAVTPARPGRVTYRQERVRCGREGCTKCPHGPYWYAYWREGGRVRSRYIGKQRPAESSAPAPRD